MDDDNIAPRDQNQVPSILFKGSDGLAYPVEGDEATGRLYVDLPSGSGTVTSVSVSSANGFAGTVANATTTPAITLSTSITGILKGNGTAISAVTIGSGLAFDGTTLSATGSGITIGTTTITSGTNTRILYNNSGVVGEYTLTGSGTVVAMATAPTFVTSITTPSVLATVNDSGALGASGTAFSDLFLASGAVIDFAAGNSVITHSSGILTVSTGDLRVTTAGTNSASVVTVGGSQTLTGKTLTTPTIAGSTITGDNDAGGATSFEIPNGAGGTTVNATGEVCVDSTSRTFNFYDGTTEAVVNPVMSKSITIENPTSSEDLTMFYSDDAITITKMVFVITGSTSATTTIRHSTDRSATGNEVVTGGTTANSTTTGNVVTSFDDATVPADSFVWLETTALSGTPTTLAVTIFYRQDA